MYAKKFENREKKNVASNFPCEYSPLDNDEMENFFLLCKRSVLFCSNNTLVKSEMKEQKNGKMNDIEIIRYLCNQEGESEKSRRISTKGRKLSDRNSN